MTALDIMARTVWGEARGEGEPGMVAVAWVIKNRSAKPGWWGDDVESVCRKPYQFSCWLAADPNSSKCAAVTPGDPYFAEALRISAAVLGGSIPDPTDGATSYCVTTLAPRIAWTAGKTPSAVIGHQTFYRE